MFDIPVGMGLPVDFVEVSALFSSLSTVGLAWLAVSAVLFLVLLVAGEAVAENAAPVEQVEGGLESIELPEAA